MSGGASQSGKFVRRSDRGRVLEISGQPFSGKGDAHGCRHHGGKFPARSLQARSTRNWRSSNGRDPLTRGASNLYKQLSAELEAAEQAGNAGPHSAGRKLKQAAGEFESMLLSDLWKSMKSTFAEQTTKMTTRRKIASTTGASRRCPAHWKAGGIGLGNLIRKHLAPHLDPAASSDILPAS